MGSNNVPYVELFHKIAICIAITRQLELCESLSTVVSFLKGRLTSDRLLQVTVPVSNPDEFDRLIADLFGQEDSTGTTDSELFRVLECGASAENDFAVDSVLDTSVLKTKTLERKEVSEREVTWRVKSFGCLQVDRNFFTNLFRKVITIPIQLLPDKEWDARNVLNKLRIDRTTITASQIATFTNLNSYILENRIKLHAQIVANDLPGKKAANAYIHSRDLPTLFCTEELKEVYRCAVELLVHTNIECFFKRVKLVCHTHREQPHTNDCFQALARLHEKLLALVPYLANAAIAVYQLGRPIHLLVRSGFDRSERPAIVHSFPPGPDLRLDHLFFHVSFEQQFSARVLQRWL